MHDIQLPPNGHILSRDYKIMTCDSSVTESNSSVDTSNIMPEKVRNAIESHFQNKGTTIPTTTSTDATLMLDNKPYYTAPKPPVPPRTVSKPKKTPEQLKEESNERERITKERIAKHIKVDVVDKIVDKEIDTEMIDYDFELSYFPSEDGKETITIIINFKKFEKLLHNGFELMMMYMAYLLKTDYYHNKIDETNESWAFGRECSSDEVDVAKCDFMQDVLFCYNCYGYNTYIVKNEKNEIIQICCDNKCLSTNKIEYTTTETGDEPPINKMIKVLSMKNELIITYDKLDREKSTVPISEEQKKLLEKLEKGMKGEIDTGFRKNYYGHNSSFHNYGYGSSNQSYNTTNYGHNVGCNSSSIYNHSSNNTKPINYTGGSSNHSSHIHIPVGSSSKSGFNVSKYGTAFKRHGGTTGVSTPGVAQSIGTPRVTYGFKRVDDGRENLVYADNKKEKFRIYTQFLGDTIKKQKEYIKHNTFADKDSLDSSLEEHWDINIATLLPKAEELEIENEAILANIMMLFNQHILEHNQLISKRKFILPFVQSDESKLYFLFGIEVLIEHYKDILIDHITKIMSLAYQENYFDIESLDKWFISKNEFIEEPSFGDSLRIKLTAWRLELDDNPDSDVFDKETCSDSDSSNGTVDENPLYDNELYSTSSSKTIQDTGIYQFNHEQDIEDMEDIENYNLFSSSPPPSYEQLDKPDSPDPSHLFSEYDSISSNKYSTSDFKYTPKTFSIENKSQIRLVE